MAEGDAFDTVFGFKGKLFLILVSITSIIVCEIMGRLNLEKLDVNDPVSNDIFVFEISRHGARTPFNFSGKP